ncbi:hypothetical protein PG990_010577 [Apiospora arundinis]
MVSHPKLVHGVTGLLASPFLSCVVAATIAATCSTALPRELQYSVTRLFEFPDTTFVENIAIRRNGHILITTFDRGRVYSIDPSEKPSPQARLAATLPDANAVTGIVETAPDVFIVTGGELNQRAMRFDPQSLRAFRLDFTSGELPAVVKTVARMPEELGLTMLNGMTAIPTSEHRGVVLAADSEKGRIVRIDTGTGAVEVIIQDDMLSPGAGAWIPLGVNGIRVSQSSTDSAHNGAAHLYFTNSARHMIGRIPIDTGGHMLGAVEHVASTSHHLFPDDFAVESETGVSYLAVHPDLVLGVTSDGVQDILVQGLLEPSSVALDPLTSNLYVVTGGSAARERMRGRNGGTGGQLLLITPVGGEHICSARPFTST